MNRFLCAAMLLASPLAAAAQGGGGGAQRGTGVPGITVDTSGVGALIDQGMNKSQVMKNLQYIADVIGPRLTGSAAVRAANDWTAKQFQSYGLDARLEQWNFGGSWERGPMWMRMVAPRSHDELGVGARHGGGRQAGDRPGGPHRCQHAREPRGVSGEGQRGVGDVAGAGERVQ